MTDQAVQLVLKGGTAPVNVNGRPRMDVTNLYPLASWVTNGQVFWGRADKYNAAPGAGLLDLNDRIVGSSKYLNQPTGQPAIIPKADTGYLGGRKTLEFPGPSGTAVPGSHLESAAAYLPATGAFALYIPVHPFSAVMDLIGGVNDRTKLFASLVNGDVRFGIAGSSTATLVSGLGTNLKNMDLLVGLIRRSDNFLVTRLLKRGDSAWSEQISATAQAGAIGTSFRLGKVRSTSDSGSNNAYGRFGGVIVHSGAMSTDQQGTTGTLGYENYLRHYYSM